MASRPRRSGADKPKEGKHGKENVVEMIKGITGASSEDVEFVLAECGGNADEATTKLLENPDLAFSQVQSKKEKKKKRDEERKSQPLPQTAEVQRGGFSGRGRGRGRERSERSGRSFERSENRSTDRGLRGYTGTGPPPGFPPHTQSGPSQVDVSFDETSATESKGWEPQGNESKGWDSQSAEPQQGSSGGWAAVASGKPENQSTSTGGWDSAAQKEPGLGSWDAVISDSDRQSTEQALGSRDAGAPAAFQPIGKQSVGQNPIRPPGPTTPGRSMADLFKKPEPPSQPINVPSANTSSSVVTKLQDTTAPNSHTGPTQTPSNLAPGTPRASGGNGTQSHEAEDTNGWGPVTSDQRIEIQGDSFGGYPGSQKQGQPNLGVIQASSALNNLPPLTQPNTSQPSNSGWKHKDEHSVSDAWGAPQTSTGLGGLGGGDSNLQHSYLGDTQNLNQGSWISKPPSSQPQTLGTAVLSSLNQPAPSQASESLPTVSPRGSEFNTNPPGYSVLGQPLSQRQPSNQSQQQGNTMQFQFGDYTGQLGSLGLDDTKSDQASTPSTHFFGQNLLPSDLRPSANPANGSESNQTPYSQPSTSASLAPPAGFSHSSLGQQGLGSISHQGLGHQGTSQTGLGNQGLTQQGLGDQSNLIQQGLGQQGVGQQNVGQQSSGHGSLHQGGQASQHQRAINAFNSAAPQSQVAPAQKTSTSTAPESSNSANQNLYSSQGYQPSTQGYSQYQYPSSNQNYQGYTSQQQEPEHSQGQTQLQSQTQTQTQAPASSQTSLGQAKRAPTNSTSYDPSNLSTYSQREYNQAPEYQASVQKYGPSGGSSGTGVHGNAATTLSQQQALSQMGSYSNQLAGMPQNFYTNQQYSFPQYSGYNQGASGNFGYGGAYQQQGYNHPTAAGYGQSNKYGAGYGASGGYQHGGYGLKEKDHQASHLGHGLYGQQQLPLGNRQHFASAGLQEHSGYGYQNPNQGYGGYGRQYGQQFYGQHQ